MSTRRHYDGNQFLKSFSLKQTRKKRHGPELRHHYHTDNVEEVSKHVHVMQQSMNQNLLAHRLLRRESLRFQEWHDYKCSVCTCQDLPSMGQARQGDGVLGTTDMWIHSPQWIRSGVSALLLLHQGFFWQDIECSRRLLFCTQNPPPRVEHLRGNSWECDACAETSSKVPGLPRRQQL